MKKIKFSLLAAIVILNLLFLSGCQTMMEPCRSELPWGKPAPWEQATPGVSF
jgi:hypothetical protein